MGKEYSEIVKAAAALNSALTAAGVTGSILLDVGENGGGALERVIPPGTAKSGVDGRYCDIAGLRFTLSERTIDGGEF
jgi:hypothetical protein